MTDARQAPCGRLLDGLAEADARLQDASASAILEWAVDRFGERYLARGAESKLPEEFSAGLFELLIAATCKEEDELMEALAAAEADGDGGRAR